MTQIEEKGFIEFIPEEKKPKVEKTEGTETKKKSNSGKKKKKKKKRTTKQRIQELLIKIGILIVGITVLVTVFFSVNVIHGNDMYPSLRDGDLVITYRLVNNYMADHVWAYKYEGETYFGRIVGVSGDVIDMSGDGYYKINGNVPYEDQFYATDPVTGQGIKYPYKVPEGTVFILGDYRIQTEDSRSFGAISTKDLIGEVVLTFRRRGF